MSTGFEAMENLHEIRADELQNDTELTEDDFKKLLKQLSKKNKDKYQFILKAGKSFHNFLFLLYRKIGTQKSNHPVGRKQSVINFLKEKEKTNNLGTRGLSTQRKTSQRHLSKL